MSTTETKSAPCCTDDCCGGTEATLNPDAVRDQVRAGYAKIAKSGSWSAAQGTQAAAAPAAKAASSCCGGDTKATGGCCGPSTLSAEQLAAAIGYTQEDLAATPEGANMGLSCGNPTAIASLKPGETVLDLGAGGGFDCFVAGPKVGATGRVIGVDMTPDMLSKARRNLASYGAQSGLAV